MRPHNRRLISIALLGAFGSLALTSVAIATRPDPIHIISQKGKRFGPHDIALHVGEHITIVNDDGDLVHQAYIDAEEFAFDSGDIEPDATIVITFPKEGDFTVLCGVHPKMKLAVHVR